MHLKEVWSQQEKKNEKLNKKEINERLAFPMDVCERKR